VVAVQHGAFLFDMLNSVATLLSMHNTTDLECKECGGSGIIWWDAYNRLGQHETHEDDCPGCGGAGTLACDNHKDRTAIVATDDGTLCAECHAMSMGSVSEMAAMGSAPADENAKTKTVPAISDEDLARERLAQMGAL
jgi:hypothetical protein